MLNLNTLKINKGELIIVDGIDGSGKSTIVNELSNFLLGSITTSLKESLHNSNYFNNKIVTIMDRGILTYIVYEHMVLNNKINNFKIKKLLLSYYQNGLRYIIYTYADYNSIKLRLNDRLIKNKPFSKLNLSILNSEFIYNLWINQFNKTLNMIEKIIKDEKLNIQIIYINNSNKS